MQNAGRANCGLVNAEYVPMWSRFYRTIGKITAMLYAGWCVILSELMKQPVLLPLFMYCNPEEDTMTTIIAGRFELQTGVDDAIEELMHAGFSREQISSFYLSPAGRHAEFPIGGDTDKSAGAKESGKGVAGGVAVGAAAGVAATPVLGPLGPVAGGLLGAHIGGLVGGLSKMKEQGEVGDEGEDAENAAPMRKSGMMVAVAVGDHEHEDHAINLLRSLGAMDIERAEGTIDNGDWHDFNPLSIPELIHDTPGQNYSGPAQRA